MNTSLTLMVIIAYADESTRRPIRTSPAVSECGSCADGNSRYVRTEARIQALTASRDSLARRISTQLDGAAFAHKPVRRSLRSSRTRRRTC